MAAKQPEFGMHHVTVVPTNFRADDSDDEDSRPDSTDRPSATR